MSFLEKFRHIHACTLIFLFVLSLHRAVQPQRDGRHLQLLERREPLMTIEMRGLQATLLAWRVLSGYVHAIVN